MLFERFKQVKAFVFDIDGVLTDGTVQVTELGEQLRTFHIRDGYALQLAVKQGYPIATITGGISKGVEQRLQALGIIHVFSGVSDKLAVLTDWLHNQQLPAGDVLYMGDDIPDLACMQAAGLPVCPADAVPEVKAIAAYISHQAGGKGAVRDVMEKVLKLQEKWQADTSVKSS